MIENCHGASPKKAVKANNNFLISDQREYISIFIRHKTLKCF